MCEKCRVQGRSAFQKRIKSFTLAFPADRLALSFGPDFLRTRNQGKGFSISLKWRSGGHGKDIKKIGWGSFGALKISNPCAMPHTPCLLSARLLQPF